MAAAVLYAVKPEGQETPHGDAIAPFLRIHVVDLILVIDMLADSTLPYGGSSRSDGGSCVASYSRLIIEYRATSYRSAVFDLVVQCAWNTACLVSLSRSARR
jgi:hypothetical protein